MANEKNAPKKFLNYFILSLILGCMVLIVVHQTINVIDYTIPEPTPMRYIDASNEYVGNGVIQDEDILPTFTPSS